MPQCITASTTLDVATLDEVGFYTVRVNPAVTSIRITFVPPSNGALVGSIDGVVVTPSGPNYGRDWIEFDYNPSELGTSFTVQVSYTAPPRGEEDGYMPPLETPTKSPKFKPQTTCPT
ncbi:hypothetical protein [Nannocystis punicea]|uniref:Uncharacterized protein n=1 Tax=Nannocystis punicea TaxID=2995304 RepID=A0ABY7GS89_9BACT|nr:hypothetical protein [Nannocystis poenicansa]WAS89739.1 hypothetical protein O0S08_26400 [Nannocystis poenicansa]